MNKFVQQIEIKYGLLIGIFVSLYVLGEYLLGFHTKYLNIGQYSGFLSAIIPIVGLYRGLRAKQNTTPDKPFTFLQLLKTGVIISAIASAIIALFFLLYNTAINPGWMQKGIELETLRMQKLGLKPDEITKNIKQLKEMYTPQAQLIGTFTGTLFNGVLLTLIISTFLSKKKPAKVTQQETSTQSV